MNNQAVIIKVNKIEKHPKADRLAIVKLFGTQVIVDNDVKEGDKLVYVDSNMKMLPDFLRENNLYKNKELNNDKTKSGFFEDHGRVKCIKLRGELSDGFLFPLSYLDYYGAAYPEEVGTEFNTVNGYVFCEKYIPSQRQVEVSRSKKERQALKRFNIPMFREHFDTGQLMRQLDDIPAHTICYIEEKVHGTSHRTARVKIPVYDYVSWWVKLLWKIINKDKNTLTEWYYLNGTRRTVHTPAFINSTYHNNTMREEVLEKVRGQLFKGEQVYLELFGHEKTGKQIQKNFPYGTEIGMYRAMIYRITMNNEDGNIVDCNREWVYRRAEELGFEAPKLFEKFYYSGTTYSREKLVESVIKYAQGQSELGAGADDTLKEGVVVWFINKNGQWQALKYKSDAFRLGESTAKDNGVVDQEDLN